jgi:hypothetical protein
MRSQDDGFGWNLRGSDFLEYMNRIDRILLNPNKELPPEPRKDAAK